MKNVIAVVLLCAVITSLCACQKAPEKEVVISKNEPVVTQNQELEKTEKPEETVSPSQRISVEKTFSSTDGSVNFSVKLNQNVSVPAAETVQVTPHILTAEDAKRAAYTLFPNGEFFEAQPWGSTVYSQREIQEKITRWSEFTSVDAVAGLYGDRKSESALEDISATVKGFIDDYTLRYESAPENSTKEPCRWTMRKSSEYMMSAEDLEGVDMSNDNDEISAQITVNGIPYSFVVTSRDKNDFKVNSIGCFIDIGESPYNMDERIFTAQLCRTAEPTAEQIEEAKNKAQTLLDSFSLGQWSVDNAEVEKSKYGEVEYAIHVTAVPCVGDAPVLRLPQLENLRNPDGYAPEQYLTDADFRFSANGELVRFFMSTPLEILNTAGGVSVMEIEDLMGRAQDALTLTDLHSYGYGSYLSFANEDLVCNVEITEAEFGLSRVKVPNSEYEYQYVPSFRLMGTSEYIGADSGKTYYADEKPVMMVVLNALDGSIISLSK